MRVALENLLYRIISSPLTQKIGRDNLIALASFAALGVFSAGVYFGVRSVRNYFNSSPAPQAGGQAQRAAAAGNAVLNPPVKPPLPEVVIVKEVKKVLDTLFKGTPYNLDNLPVYPDVVDSKIGLDDTKATDDIMKGTTNKGHRFILIKVSRDASNQELIDCVSELKIDPKGKTRFNRMVILSQYHPNGPMFWGGDGKYMWDQLNRGGTFTPNFFTGNFTDPTTGEGPLPSQVENFERMHTLLRTGESTDANGLLWKIGHK